MLYTGTRFNRAVIRWLHGPARPKSGPIIPLILLRELDRPGDGTISRRPDKRTRSSFRVKNFMNLQRAWAYLASEFILSQMALTLAGSGLMPTHRIGGSGC